MPKHEPIKAALELREQLASEKRKLGFFFGAGTSMAVGLPGIEALTEGVEKALGAPFKDQFNAVKAEVSGDPNVEDILNRIRLYRELIADSDKAEYCGIVGKEDARKLDVAVCQKISEIVSITPDSIDAHMILANFIRSLHANRDNPVEVFTTNYDLIIEQAFELSQLPYFDGFVGSVFPFFFQESVEAELVQKQYLRFYAPSSWTRLWKVHGSINWGIYKSDNLRICRFSGSPKDEAQELMVFPSREKYSQSRKMPFITLQDRLRKFLTTGETLLVVHGYSFSDDHINEIVFQSLRANQHLSIMVFVYEKLPEEYQKFGQDYRNLSFYSPDKVCIGGITSEWSEPSRKNEVGGWSFWDEKKKEFTLGNFGKFASYLETFIG
ncbi:SIR2 family protein, partial [Candidatus Pacearchaeota archaeon]|nr:SIR2 family protein [Candidatus Pacearchaeota archaeon]